MLDNSTVLQRVNDLAEQNKGLVGERFRIRAIMNGGADGIAAIMAWNQGKGTSGRNNAQSLGEDLPAVNMMASGVERIAQKIGQTPTLQVPYGPRESDRARNAAEKRERIVNGWDDLSSLEMQYPQVGRWLPGYGYYSWMLIPKKDPVTGQYYPHLQLRDPFDTWPGYFGPDQQPKDVAYRRVVPLRALKALYPRDDWETHERKLAGVANSRGANSGSAGLYGVKHERGWEGESSGVAVIEYVCDWGTYVVAPECELVVDYIPNPCDTGTLAIFGKRYAFDKLVSQYHHVIGLVSMQAKLNVLALIASEDSTFKETNVFGEQEGDVYEMGRKAINYFAANARVERPANENNQQLFMQIDRVERQLRIGAAYDQGSDSLAARGGFITGRGQEALRDPIEANVAEYHKVVANCNRQADTRRLEWEEKVERSKRKRVFWIEGNKASEETYVPKVDIAGAWRTTRLFGMMAGWDDPSKIVTGLQLLQAEVIDIIEFQKNLTGLDDLTKINERVVQNRVRKALMSGLEMMMSQGDPNAAMALVEIMDNPDDMMDILKKHYTPQEPQMSPEEQAMAQAQQMGMGGGGDVGGGGIPSVQTVLSRMTSGGQTEGGVQTVGTNVA